MKFMVLVLILLILMFVCEVLLLRKYYIDWCKSFRNKKKSRELIERMEFLIKFIAVILLLIIFVATMIYDCLMMKGR